MRHLSIQELHQDYNNGVTTPSQVVEGYLGSIRKSHHNAYISVLEKRVREQAIRADLELKKTGKVPSDRLPLFGVPMAYKDLLTVKGERTTAASKMLENYIPPYTATCIARLEEAGALGLGKVNLDEFAMGGSNENSAFGPVDHPTHAGFTPGGSSGGSATAVGADLCHASLGSDTGGSIRLPAHFCGIVGFKPSYGRISRHGVIAFASSLDQVGPMTKSVYDAALLTEVMAGEDIKDSAMIAGQSPKFTQDLFKQGIDLRGVRVGVPKEYWGDGLDPDMSRVLRERLKQIKEAGATLVEVSLPHTKYSVSVYYLVAVSEASSNLSRMDGMRFGVRPAQADMASSLEEQYQISRSLFGSEVKRRILLGTFALSSGYYDAYYKRACQVRRLIAQDFDSVFTKCDVLVGAISATPAFKRTEKEQDPLKLYLNDILTIPANLAGLPALSLPVGTIRSEKLPIGLHVIAPRERDESLLQFAQSLETLFQNASQLGRK